MTKRKNKTGLTSPDYERLKEAARKALFGAMNPNDLLAALVRFICAKLRRPAPLEKDMLTVEKWQAMIESAARQDRKEWAVSPSYFAMWLMRYKTIREGENTLTYPSGIGDLGVLITYIEKAKSESKVFMDVENRKPVFTVNNMFLMIPSWHSEPTGEQPDIGQVIMASHLVWMDYYKEYGKHHILAKSVEAWVLGRPLPAKEYPTAIMPRYAGSVIEVAYTDVEAGSVLQSQETERAFEKLNTQRDLFPPPEHRLPLTVSQVQGIKETDHQGQVSQELRILHESYLATTGYEIGINGILVAFDFDYFRDALYPGWRDKRNKQGKRVSFHTVNRDRIRQSIDNLRKAYIEVPEFGPIAPVVSRTPVEKLSRGTDKVVLHVISPHGTRRGGLIIAKTMRQLGFLGGRGSARKYAFYHALVQYWDNYGTENKSIIWPTVPAKKRDSEGRLIDEKGEVILDKNGKPETRWKKGVQVYDDKGEKIYEPNKDKRLARYRVVSRTELVGFFGMNRWKKVNALLDEMESEKVFVMQEAGDGYRFFPSIEHCRAYKNVQTSKS